MSDQLTYASSPPLAAISSVPAGDLPLTFEQFSAQMRGLGVLRRCSGIHPGDLAFVCDGGECRCLVCGRAS